MIQIKRVYEAAEKKDGQRFLVDRLWPRGVKKTTLVIEAWLKDIAPSNELRAWYHHDLALWDEFRLRYSRELEKNSDVWLPLLEAARRGTITLLYSSRHADRNNAVALREFLTRKLDSRKKV